MPHSKIIELMVPIFLTVLAGYVFGRLKEINLKPIVDLTLYIMIPSLIISSIVRVPLILRELAVIPAAAAFVILATGGVTFLFMKFFKMEKSPGMYMGSMFMNSGIIAFPLILAAFGSRGLTEAIVYDATNAILIFSLGIYILVGKDSLKQIARLPAIYSIAAALLINLIGFELPKPLLNALSSVGESSLPIMLLVLGYQLNYLRIHKVEHAILSSILRLGLGFGLSLLFVKVFNITGLMKSVIVLSSSMPTALNSLLLSEEFQKDADLAASAVAITTLASLITIPLVIRYIM
jgi:hypothetical protein